MSNANKAAFGAVAVISDGVSIRQYHQEGLSKRELIAAMAMQGLLSDASRVKPKATNEDVIKDMAALAVPIADALLAELEKPKG